MAAKFFRATYWNSSLKQALRGSQGDRLNQWRRQCRLNAFRPRSAKRYARAALLALFAAIRLKAPPRRQYGSSGGAAATRQGIAKLHLAPRSAMRLTMSVVFRWMAWLLLVAIALSTLCPIALRPVTGVSADLERALAFALIGSA